MDPGKWMWPWLFYTRNKGPSILSVYDCCTWHCHWPPITTLKIRDWDSGLSLAHFHPCSCRHLSRLTTSLQPGLISTLPFSEGHALGLHHTSSCQRASVYLTHYVYCPNGSELRRQTPLTPLNPKQGLHWRALHINDGVSRHLLAGA